MSSITPLNVGEARKNPVADEAAFQLMMAHFRDCPTCADEASDDVCSDGESLRRRALIVISVLPARSTCPQCTRVWQYIPLDYEAGRWVAHCVCGYVWLEHNG